MDHISKIWEDLDVDIDTNIQNLTCFGKVMCTYINPLLRNVVKWLDTL